MGRRRGRQRKIACIATVICAITAGSLWYFLHVSAHHTKLKPDRTDAEGTTAQNPNDRIVTATGLTEIGTEPVIFAIDFLEDTRLCIEEVYLSEGGTITAGEKCIKFTQDSIDRARAELEKTAQRAELAYRNKVISDGEDRMQAKYTYDMALLEAEYAPQVYQDTLTRLEMELVRAQKDYTEAQEAYSAYENAVKNNTFYEDFQIETLKKAYEDAYDLCTRRAQYWDVTEEELQTLSNDSNRARAGQDDRQWIIKTVALLREEALEAKAEYEQAQQDYQREIEGAELKLHKLLNQLEQAGQKYVDAQVELQKGSLHAKTVSEMTAAKGQMAENDYNVRLMRLTGDLEQQKDAWDEAVKNKELFEQLAGDGYLYAENTGIIAMLAVEKGQELAGGEQIFSYGNPEEISVSVTVPEADRAKLYVGERAGVAIADCGNFEGAIKMIQPMTTARGKDSLYSMVTVSLESDVSALEPDMTATVVFGGEDGIPEYEPVIYDIAPRTYAVDIRETGRGTVKSDELSQMYDADIYPETDDGNTAYLKIEEIYAEPGQDIKKGDPVCRFTQDSIETVRKALVQAQSKARIALMEAQTSYHTGVLEAGLSHNEALTDASLAQTVYDNTIAGLNSDMIAKALAIEQTLAEICQLQLSLTDEDHEEQRTEITRAYEQAKGQMARAGEHFVSRQVEVAQDFQAAKEAYNAFFDQFKDSSQQIADKVAEIDAMQKELLRCQQLMEGELLSAEQTRIQSLTRGETANATYASSVRAYEKAVSKAQADMEQAAQKLDHFNEFAGEGILYATDDGFVLEIGFDKGDLLADPEKLVSFVAAADSREGDIH